MYTDTHIFRCICRQSIISRRVVHGGLSSELTFGDIDMYISRCVYRHIYHTYIYRHTNISRCKAVPYMYRYRAELLRIIPDLKAHKSARCRGPRRAAMSHTLPLWPALFAATHVCRFSVKNLMAESQFVSVMRFMSHESCESIRVCCHCVCKFRARRGMAASQTISVTNCMRHTICVTMRVCHPFCLPISC